MTAAVGGPHFKPARPPAVNVFRGQFLEIWRGEEHLGLAYQWVVHGTNGQWGGTANKYRLLHSVDGGEVQFRLYLESEAGSALLIATGHVIETLVADGEIHKDAISLKGTKLEVA